VLSLGFDQISAVMVARDKQHMPETPDVAKASTAVATTGEKKPEINSMILSLQISGVSADVGQLQPPFNLTSNVSIIDPFGVTVTGTMEPAVTSTGQKLTMVLDTFLQAINARISYQDIKMILLMANGFSAVVARHVTVYVKEKSVDLDSSQLAVLLSPYLIVDRKLRLEEEKLAQSVSLENLPLPIDLNLSVRTKTALFLFFFFFFFFFFLFFSFFFSFFFFSSDFSRLLGGCGC